MSNNLREGSETCHEKTHRGAETGSGPKASVENQTQPGGNLADLHGRIEKREYYLFSDLTWFPDLAKWKNLHALLMVKSTRQIIGREPTAETRYYITSLTSVRDAAAAVRAHWGVENNLHWVLDVVFKEDDWKSKEATAATNLAAIRRFTYNLLKAHPDKHTTPIKRYMGSLNLNFLESVVFNPQLFS